VCLHNLIDNELYEDKLILKLVPTNTRMDNHSFIFGVLCLTVKLGCQTKIVHMEMFGVHIENILRKYFIVRINFKSSILSFSVIVYSEFFYIKHVC
jgi:hypothetical protein